MVLVGRGIAGGGHRRVGAHRLVGGGPESRPSTSEVVDAAAVASEQLSYEASLIEVALPRLAAPDAAAAIRVRAATASLGPTLATDLRRWGVTPESATRLWEARIGDGAPPPDEAQYSCSLRDQQTNVEDLDTTPAASLAAELGTIELTLLARRGPSAGDRDDLPSPAGLHPGPGPARRPSPSRPPVAPDGPVICGIGVGRPVIRPQPDLAWHTAPVRVHLPAERAS